MFGSKRRFNRQLQRGDIGSVAFAEYAISQNLQSMPPVYRDAMRMRFLMDPQGAYEAFCEGNLTMRREDFDAVMKRLLVDGLVL